MNIQQLRQSLKLKWVNYYYKNRSWLTKMKIWATYDGQRRPSSGFILATLSALEPQMEQLFPFILELNNNPDQIISALGLNFNPEEHLHLVKDNFVADNQEQSESSSDQVVTEKPSPHIRNHQPSGFKKATTEIKKPTSSIAHVSADHSESPPSSISESTDVEPIAIDTNVQNKGRPILPIRLTKGENNSVISIAVAGIETKSKPLTSVAVATKNGNNSNVVLSNAVTTKIQRKSLLSTAVDCETQSKNKLVTIQTRDVATNEVSLSSTTKCCKLANWIDDFCQGKEWDRDEAGFTPF
ncbi:DUF5331 domain-containing protein [Aetokthonos hydrillicola Thurmond2011]|jgi:hypothetical protein|uniref:DUF5331 domain-containing protein n=1 Tax=Aetokthonos hydrillicola Thurmond2011 TaxID=2712845 RepID=A0AAP5I7N5_9CYAN|nr:DUF5331 domain-containing protein [Aetokthonos hydrillicola]MBO3459807.1 DUF5331 domain-containing protein [Aetokthonos hydrillicola CCALA 1050]MBW4584548.1 DUF5331 domain-containing protein [Aetokthonos hydrillicola CCALA 1050]MDR9895092.1 DUF5331 domain-containing protein [Aetokthonos hydrillicola Thurmond2011]